MKIILITFCLLFTFCEQEDIKYELAGYAQKGPFITGSDVTIIELDGNLVPTGRTYFSTIEDNSGYFSFPEVSFSSNFVQIKVEGNYFEEIFGGVVMSDLTISSIVDLSNESGANVNIMGHFEQGRIMNLVKNNNKSFKEAQEQAHNELLKVFSLEDLGISKPEKLDLTSSTIDGGVLLFISSIIQHFFLSQMQLQELITNFSTDFKEDGIINSANIQTTLATAALALDFETIKANLTSRYSEMGKSINLYEMYSLQKQFLDNTTFPNMFYGFFPESVDNAINLLALADTVYIDKNLNYCIAVDDAVGGDLGSIAVFLKSADLNNFSTSGADWFREETQLVYYQGLGSDSDISMPISFINSGEIELGLNFVLKYGGHLSYPKKYIIWE